MRTTDTETRKRILETAGRLFQVQGYNATGINQIIAEAGIAKATLYQHFKSKEELCKTYLADRHLYWIENLNLFISKRIAGGEKPLEAAFNYIKHMNRKEDFRGCAFINLASETPSIRDHDVLRIIQDHKHDLKKILTLLLDGKESSKKEKLGEMIYTLYEGAIVASSLHKRNWPVEVSKELVEKIT